MKMAFNYYKFMLEDLASNCLKICLIDAPEPKHTGHKVRVAFTQNPEWYRQLCLNHPAKSRTHKRKFDTAVKRQHIIRLLSRLACGLESTSIYAKELRNIAERMQQEDSILDNPPF